MIRLDTSFLISCMDPGSPVNRKMGAWIREGETFSMSPVAWAEFLCGPLAEPEIGSATKIVDRCENFTPERVSDAARPFDEFGTT